MELQLTYISLNFQTSSYNLKIRNLGAKLCVSCILFWFWKELWRFKVNAFCWTTLIKTKRSRKWKIQHTVLEKWTLCFSSYKNRKLKVNLWWVGARKRKKRVFFAPFILSEGNFFNICVFAQCILYWIHFQNIHTFTYQKTLLHALLLLVFKTVESFHCILN